MSSVLKALKKLEDEQRGSSPSSSATANQRWASGGVTERSHRPWLLVTVGLAIGLLVAGALLWFGRQEVSVVTPPVAASAPMANSPTVTVVTAPPVVAVKPLRPTAAGKVETVASAPELAPPVVVPPQITPVVINTSPPAPAPVIPSARSAAPATLSEVPVKQVQVDRFEIPVAGQQWVAPPQLTVSEIFPATGGGRMAIVNGLPVMAGTMVEDALVEEIHDDRVVVSIDGRRAVLSLGRGR